MHHYVRHSYDVIATLHEMAFQEMAHIAIFVVQLFDTKSSITIHSTLREI